MKGLEIIEYIAVKQVPDIVFLCLLLGTFSILILTFVVYWSTKDLNKAVIAEFISGVVYLVFISGLLMSRVLEIPTGEYRYKVRITEDIGYVEFTDKYDVLTKNDDGTYIIQEKNS